LKNEMEKLLIFFVAIDTGCEEKSKEQYYQTCKISRKERIPQSSREMEKS